MTASTYVIDKQHKKLLVLSVSLARGGVIMLLCDYNSHNASKRQPRDSETLQIHSPGSYDIRKQQIVTKSIHFQDERGGGGDCNK